MTARGHTARAVVVFASVLSSLNLVATPRASDVESDGIHCLTCGDHHESSHFLGAGKVSESFEGETTLLTSFQSESFEGETTLLTSFQTTEVLYGLGALAAVCLIVGARAKLSLPSAKTQKVVALVAIIWTSCCVNTISLELIQRSSHLITGVQFFIVVLFGIFGRFERTSPALGIRLKKRVCPMKYYVLMVTLYFVVSSINNKVLDYGVALPLQLIIRSGSLLANVVLAVAFLKREYSNGQYLGVSLVTVGVVISTLASMSQVETTQVSLPFTTWLVGVSLLVLTLFLISFLGIIQEKLYSIYGPFVDESLFYTNALALPMFGIFWKEVATSVQEFNEREVVDIGVFIPFPWLLLFINMITHYGCLRGVYELSGETSSVTATLVITIRKFISIVFSVLYFKNPFTLNHWLATCCVFVGTLLYSMYRLPPPSKDKKE